MGPAAAAGAPVVVVGGGLAGLAAAARLAKVGHRVTLLEATDRLGGAWAPYELDGVLVDRAPGVLRFPAPWRDLFRKSGRPLEAELARSGAGLEPAPPTRYQFFDGTELTLPTERGQQLAVMSEAYGAAAAVRWRDLLDGLDHVWQAVRPLGLEAELSGRAQLTAAKKALRPRQTLVRLARELEEPHLAAILLSTAYRLGSTPERTPAWCAVELVVERTFGRWRITSDAPGQTGRSSVLVDALAERLRLRKVEVRLGKRVERMLTSDGRVTGVTTGTGERVAAAAVVCTTDPWESYEKLWPTEPTRRQRRAVTGWQPALAPRVTHLVTSGPAVASTEGAETVRLTAHGVPTLSYTRPTPAGLLHTELDYGDPLRSRSAGIAWDGFRSWPARPSVTTDVPGLFLAGPFSPGGGSPSAVILSGALASYAGHDYLD
jgi:UDP-galactopyranose mutase